MDTLTSLHDLKSLLSSIIDGQSVSLEDNIADSYKLLEQDKLKGVYIKNSMILLQSLEIMHKENIINTEQFNSRIIALRNILGLVEELSSIEEE
ncbi:hypothetical protein [Sporosarcina sp. FA9]|uniref:hypothetical protein n=1 Tax=Sporosarcina sp. FA9 TaxID=3413030 RepID=UPI003F659238